MDVFILMNVNSFIYKIACKYRCMWYKTIMNDGYLITDKR